MSGVFGMASGGSQNFVTLAVLLGLVGCVVLKPYTTRILTFIGRVGVGGNFPVDAAVFLGTTSILLGRFP